MKMGGQSRAQRLNRLRVKLRDPRFVDAENLADFFHGQLFVVVQGHNQPIAFVESLKRTSQ